MNNVKMILNYKRVIQTRPYESATVQFGIEADLSDKENYEELSSEYFDLLKEMVENEIIGIIQDESK